MVQLFLLSQSRECRNICRITRTKPCTGKVTIMEIVTNENLYQIDWSAGDRKKFLQNFKAPGKSLFNRCFAEATEMKDIWMSDVSATDARSIKAQLRGAGDYRALWWNFNDSIYRLFHPQADLHLSMYAFHERQGAMTLGLMKYKILFKATRQAIISSGLVAGIEALKAHAKKV